MVDNDTWIFGLNDGAFLTTTRQMERQTYQPQMVLTCLEVRGESSEVRGEKQVSEWWNIERMDTLTLQPHERNITLHFAAIDYQAPERISYAFRLMTDGQRDTTQWNYIGTNRKGFKEEIRPNAANRPMGRESTKVIQKISNVTWVPSSIRVIVCNRLSIDKKTPFQNKSTVDSIVLHTAQK